MTRSQLHLRRRFLLLRALRWLPSGLLIPVFVLYVLSRGFTLSQFGTALAAQAVVVLLLELPTGGLADAIGPRPVLILANIADLASIGLLLVADSFPALVVVWAIQGLYRSLESGPLEAWYVSNALDMDAATDVERDLAKANVVLGVAVAIGAIASSALVTLAPAIGVTPLLLPIVVAMGFRAVDLGAVALLITNPAGDIQRPSFHFSQKFAEVPTVVNHAIKLIAASPVLLALLGVELLWGIGLVGFETLFPPRLAAIVGNPEQAATILGPLSTAAWLLSAAGSAGAPTLSKRLGSANTAALLRISQGATVFALAILAGPIGLLAAYLATLAIHGASNTVHSGILHLNTNSHHRTTVLSANSMAGHLGGGLGSIGLGVIAARFGLTPAIIIAAAILAAAAPLYLQTRRSNQSPPQTPAGCGLPPVTSKRECQEVCGSG